jgi:2-succinyl-6-hydroxy-2,4-cyclohexadiene-1-carboxylate synthase
LALALDASPRVRPFSDEERIFHRLLRQLVFYDFLVRPTAQANAWSVAGLVSQTLDYFQMPLAPLKYTELYYEDTGGSLPVILFINGWALSERYWHETTRLLQPDFRCITFDASGTGRSKPNAASKNSPADVESFAEDAAELIQYLNLKDVHLVGHSMGAMVAAFLYGLKPQHISSLTLVNCGSFEYSYINEVMLSFFVKSSLALSWVASLPLLRNTLVKKATAKPIPSAYGEMLINDFRTTDPEIAKQVGTNSIEKLQTDRYETTVLAAQCPLLIAVGDKDDTIPPAGSYRLYELCPHARFVRFADCGHMPMLESPEAFAGVLRRHFANEFVVAATRNPAHA